MQQLIPASVMPHVKRFGFSGLIALAIVAVMLMGVNPVTVLTGQSSPPPPPNSITGVPAEGADAEALSTYASIINAEHDAYWQRAFRIAAVGYAPPKFIVAHTSKEFGCGMAGTELGTFYCRPERTIYVDLSAYEKLARQYGTPAHWAEALAISYAYGNHVQYLVDFYTYGDGKMPAAPVSASPEDVLAGQRLGMQAYCYTAVWAKTAGLPHLLQDPQVVRAIDAVMSNGPAAERALAAGIYKALPAPTVADRTKWFDKGFDVPASGTCKMSNIIAG